MKSLRPVSRQHILRQAASRASSRPFPPTLAPPCPTCASRSFKTDASTRAHKASYPLPLEAKPFTKQANELARGFGFLFDCDGVLYQGGKQIQSAGPALRLCRSHDAGYLFLTNGGGNTNEQEKAASLHKKMGIPKEEDLINDRVIQSHTPLSKIFGQRVKEDQTIYTTSLDPDKAREIIQGYGFKNVVTAADLIDQYEHIFPFDPKQIAKATARAFPGDVKLYHGANGFDYNKGKMQGHLKVDHIFVLNDPRDWALETQIIYDLLASHQGYYGTLSDRNGHAEYENKGWQKDGQPDLWFSNMDMFWKTEHPMNRFGTGAFVHAFASVWEAATGVKLSYNYLGKPGLNTYDFAHDSLLAPLGPGKTQKSLRRVYMVGDNPESDIRGALEYKPADGTQYVPILVKTGVWQETEAESRPNWEPAVIVDDVLDAVVWAMRQEGIDVDRQTAMKKLSSG